MLAMAEVVIQLALQGAIAAHLAEDLALADLHVNGVDEDHRIHRVVVDALPAP